MSVEETPADEQGKLAYTIIQSLLDGHEKLGDLLVLMAHAIDEDTLKALAGTMQWEAYLDSKRELEQTKARIDEFITRLKAHENA
ncbi:MAG TPA: hypothetical protein PKC65_00910 [Pyrinomonadaceae bacterium]|nr:hypothetical protein [Pyrinomonadaceae bacterium]